MGLEWEKIVKISPTFAFLGLMFFWFCTFLYAYELSQARSIFHQVAGYAIGFLGTISGISLSFYVFDVEQKAKEMQEKLDLIERAYPEKQWRSGIANFAAHKRSNEK